MQLLTYPGGKSRLGPWIIEHFPKHDIYCEPFGGSAAVLLQKEPAKLEIYNDIDQQLVNFFTVLRDHPDEFRRLIELTPYSRNIEASQTDDKIELARRFFQVSVTHWHDGYFKTQKRNPSGGTLIGVYERQKGYLLKAAQRLNRVIIEHLDAVRCIEKYDSPEMLFYCDPPYFGTRKPKLYRNEMMEPTAHLELADALKACKGQVIVSGYSTQFYEDIYKGWTKVTRHAQARSKDMRLECLWIKPSNNAIRIAAVAPRIKTLGEIINKHVKRAAVDGENGNVMNGRPKKVRPSRTFLSQSERAANKGISRRSQQRLDKIARLQPDLLKQIAKGNLSICGALRICEPGTTQKSITPVEKLKSTFLSLPESDQGVFIEWLSGRTARQPRPKLRCVK